MRRMLDPKEAGGSLPSTIKFDAEGNRTASKDLGVDGKLKLKSLVSASNPDGDITKELGGGGGGTTRHGYIIFLNGNFYYLVYTNKDYSLPIGEFFNANDFTTNSNYQELRKNGYYPAGGYYGKFDRSATLMRINNNGFSLRGNFGTNKTFGFKTADMSSEVAIIKLF